MQISAGNLHKGTVKKVVQGAAGTEVTIELEGGAEIVSIIAKTSAKALGLKKNKEVFAVIKASDVMIAAE